MARLSVNRGRREVDVHSQTPAHCAAADTFGLLGSLPLRTPHPARGASRAKDELRPYAIVGDAIPQSLTGAKGDAERGRSIVVNRQVGLCLLCHSGPYPHEKFQGTLAPDLKGTGSRWSEGQLRLRIVDASRLNPDTIMPASIASRILCGWRPRSKVDRC